MILNSPQALRRSQPRRVERQRQQQHELARLLTFQSDGELLVEKSPSAEETEHWHAFGMVAQSREDIDIEYDRAWSTDEIDKWIRLLFPKAGYYYRSHDKSYSL